MSRPLGTRRHVSASVAGLAFGVAALLAALAARADAQAGAGMTLDIIMRSGERGIEHASGWRGISADWVNIDSRKLNRFDVRIVCAERCPADLPPTEVAEDTVVWRTGPSTKGAVEVACGESGECVVRQNGRSRPWGDVRYVQLRASLGGCFAKLDRRLDGVGRDRRGPFAAMSFAVS